MEIYDQKVLTAYERYLWTKSVVSIYLANLRLQGLRVDGEYINKLIRDVYSLCSTEKDMKDWLELRLKRISVSP